MLQDIMLKATRIWKKAHNLPTAMLVQNLNCFNEGKISLSNTGDLIGPNDSFNCIKLERCAAAEYLYDDESALKSMLDALHPNKLSVAIANKQETKQRKKAIKLLLQDGPKNFHKGKCRALGDAYFTAMCPANYAVVTSNMDDHEPLCSALNKIAKEP